MRDHSVNCKLNETGERLIVHKLLLEQRPANSRVVILACHETDLFPVREIPAPFWDKLVFVSELQKQWHGV